MTPQEWLPALQVWASKVDKSEVSTQPSKRRKTDLLLPQPASLPSRSEAGDLVPTCPICLTGIDTESCRTLVVSCLHTFCKDCLSQWTERSRACPLCKGHIQGYLYDIRSETDFKERHLPPLPPRQAVDTSYAHGSGPAIVDLHRQQRQQQRAAAGTAARRSRWDDSAPQQPHQPRPSQTSQGPRPYYYRVRQQLEANTNRQQTASTSAPISLPPPAEDSPIAWRRHIYAQHLYAVPPGTVAGVARAVVRKERLEEWLDRELTAILGTDDVALVRMYVLGVLSAEQGQHVMQSVTRVAPVEALQPFLATAAAHFWHELRCFAAAPYSMTTYDRVVQYQRAPAAQDEAALASRTVHSSCWPVWRAQAANISQQRPAGQPGSNVASTQPVVLDLTSSRESTPQAASPVVSPETACPQAHPEQRHADQSNWQQTNACGRSVSNCQAVRDRVEQRHSLRHVSRTLKEHHWVTNSEQHADVSHIRAARTEKRLVRRACSSDCKDLPDSAQASSHRPSSGHRSSAQHSSGSERWQMAGPALE